MEDWADLPWTALNRISKFLPFAADYVRFRSVCRSWRSSAPKRPNLPILAGHLLDGNGLLTIFNFFSFNGSQIIPIDSERLREISLDRFCCGSSHGWMSFLDRSPGITLWNPMTKKHIQLPNITLYPDDFDCKVSKVDDEFIYSRGFQHGNEKVEVTYARSFEHIKSYLASKVVLSSDPSSDPNCVALLIHCWWRKLSFCRLGDDAWTTVQLCDFESSCMDAVFYRGKFHIVSLLGIYILNLGQEPMLERIPVADLISDGVPRLPEIDDRYLIESAGDLLLVDACHSAEVDFGVDHDTVCLFDVFKVDWGMHRLKLLRLKSLGDRSLFLGRNQSISLSASKFSGCRANCIYMAEYYSERTKIRVYNLEDRSNDFISNDAAEYSSGWRPCAWVMPSLL